MTCVRLDFSAICCCENRIRKNRIRNCYLLACHANGSCLAGRSPEPSARRALDTYSHYKPNQQRVSTSNCRIAPPTLNDTMARTKLPKTTSRRPRKLLACMTAGVSRSGAYYPPHGGARDWTDTEDEQTTFLHDLCFVQTVWERICWLGSGSGVFGLSQASHHVRQATLATPAFQFLSGRDADGFVVPWIYPTNTLACASNFAGWNSTHFRIRAESPETVSDVVREMMAITAATSLQDGIANAAHEYNYEDDFLYGAVARPSTACSDYSNHCIYNYNQPNPAESAETVSDSTVLFPPLAHKCAPVKLARRRFYAWSESCGESGESSASRDESSDSD